jgi:hypothetical protein
MAINSEHSHRARSARHRWLAGVLALAAVPLFYSGCGDSVDSRHALGQEVQQRRFGADARLLAQIAPGVLDSASVDGVSGTAAVIAWGSAPFVELTLSNGSFASTPFELTLQNVDGRASVDATVGSLPVAQRRDSRCAQPDFVDQPTVVLAPLEPRQRQRTSMQLGLTVPACALVTLRTRPVQTQGFYRVAVAGSVQSRRDQLEDAQLAALSAGADHLHVLGDVSISTSATVLRVAALRDFTFSYSLGEDDVGANWESLIRALGPADWVARIGQVRLINVDAADGVVTAEQWTLLTPFQRLVSPPPALAWMTIPPVDRQGVGERSFHSFTQAARMMELLRRAGASLLVSSSTAQDVRHTMSGVDLVTLSGGRQDAGRRRLLLVDIRQPVSGLLSCTSDADCSTGTVCRELLCMPACASDADCAPDRTFCDEVAGACRIGCSADDACATVGGSCLTVAGYCSERARYAWSWRAY